MLQEEGRRDRRRKQKGTMRIRETQAKRERSPERKRRKERRGDRREMKIRERTREVPAVVFHKARCYPA